MPVQDDEREIELVRIFNLEVAEDRVRDGIDANLLVDGVPIEFELKSTSGKSISTVRDFGPEHIRKWENLHWIFGFYNKQGNRLLYTIYASPDDMRPWIDDKRDYVAPDFMLAGHAPDLVTARMMHDILGERREYTLYDARRIQKRQYSMDEYREMMDLPEGYTPERMLEILQDRHRYLVERGSTLNNPHIPGSYFDDFDRITSDHANQLRIRLRAWLGG